MTRLRFFGLLVLFIAAALGEKTLVGQSLTTTAVSGRVDNENAGLPGVAVTLASPSLQGTRTATTSANGDYTFVGIPPGNYTVTFALQGFKTVTKTLQLAVSAQNVLNATLSLNEITATATVSARAEIVSTTSQASTTITSELANKLPIARTVAAEAALSSGGARTPAASSSSSSPASPRRKRSSSGCARSTRQRTPREKSSSGRKGAGSSRKMRDSEVTPGKPGRQAPSRRIACPYFFFGGRTPVTVNVALVSAVFFNTSSVIDTLTS